VELFGKVGEDFVLDTISRPPYPSVDPLTHQSTPLPISRPPYPSVDPLTHQPTPLPISRPPYLAVKLFGEVGEDLVLDAHVPPLLELECRPAREEVFIDG